MCLNILTRVNFFMRVKLLTHQRVNSSINLTALITTTTAAITVLHCVSKKNM